MNTGYGWFWFLYWVMGLFAMGLFVVIEKKPKWSEILITFAIWPLALGCMFGEFSERLLKVLEK